VAGSRLTLEDGSRVAVVGGGPAGCFFSIFLLRLARLIDIEIAVDVFEYRNFKADGPAGCNMCAGVVSESLVQLLSVEGIIIPDHLVERTIGSYVFHTPEGSIELEPPSAEARIAAMYRGGGPRTEKKGEVASLDQFLLELAQQSGANVIKRRVKSFRILPEKVVLEDEKEDLHEADLMIGAFGVNSPLNRQIDELTPDYRKPVSAKALQAEIPMGEKLVSERFSTAIHVFLAKFPDIRLASMTPKRNHVTVSLIGEDVSTASVIPFLETDVVRRCIGEDTVIPEKFCHCGPRINVREAKGAFGDRFCVVGDSFVARLFKDGIGSAYLTAKMAANVSLLHGIAKEDYARYYLPFCKNIIRDNRWGRFLFRMNDFICGSSWIRGGMLRTLEAEKKGPRSERRLTQILWDMFTGSDTYRNILSHTFDPGLHRALIGSFLFKR